MLEPYLWELESGTRAAKAFWHENEGSTNEEMRKEFIRMRALGGLRL